MKKFFSLCVFSTLLVACGDAPLLQAQKVDYKSSVTLPSLETPPDLTQPATGDQFVIPGDKSSPASNQSAATYSAYAASHNTAASVGNNDVLPQVAGMKIVRAGCERWLVVPGTPEQLWPKLKAFWLSVGLPIVKENPTAGVMETDWAENQAKLPQDFIRRSVGKLFDSLYDTGQRDKYRTRLERGSAPGTSEIYISHRALVEVYVNSDHVQTAWQYAPSDPDLEAEMLQLLMVSLGAKKETAKQLVNQPKPADKATLQPVAGAPDQLELADAFDRAWRRVGLALDREGFAVEDRDRSKGIFYVRYIDADAEKNEPSFWSKLAIWRDQPTVKDSNKYRIEVKAQGEQSLVRVLNETGALATTETARRILTLLQQQLK